MLDPFVVSLIDRISHTRFQRYTDLQSPVTCLDHGDIAIQCAVMQGSVRLRDAWKCIEIFALMHACMRI